MTANQNPIKKPQLPSLEHNSFVDPNIATCALALWNTKDGHSTSAVQLLVRQNDVRGDESGEHPGEEFVMLTITHEELLAMVKATGGDIHDCYGTLYDDWFRSQQGKPYNGFYTFAQAAWHAAIASIKGAAA